MSDSINAIDVKYQTEISVEAKSTEQLTVEINVKYHQAENLAAMSMAELAQAGRRIIEVKRRLKHGEFGDWCKNNLDFSQDKANKMMNLAEKYEDKNSIFANSETFQNIGISTVWALLAAPEEVAAEVIETQNVTDMTVRELKDEIARIKKRNEELETENKELEDESEEHWARHDAQQIEIEKLETQLRIAEEKNESASEEAIEKIKADAAKTQQDIEKIKEDAAKTQQALQEEAREAREAAAAEIEKLNKKLETARKDLKDQKEKQKKLEAAKDEEIRKGIQEALPEIEKKAKEEGAADAAATLAQNAEDIERLEAEVSRLEAEKAKLSNNTLMEFKVYCDQLQDVYFHICDLITEQNEHDPEVGLKMQNALIKLVGEWRP